MKHTITVNNMDNYFIPGGKISFEIDDKENYEFVSYGTGEVEIYNKDLEAINKKLDNAHLYFVCEYPYFEDDIHWYFAIEVYVKDENSEFDDYDFYDAYEIKNKLPDSVKENIANQLVVDKWKYYITDEEYEELYRD